MTSAVTYDPSMPDANRIPRTEAAEILGVSLSQLAYLARAGKLRRYQNTETGRVTYDAREVEELRKRRQDS